MFSFRCGCRSIRDEARKISARFRKRSIIAALDASCDLAVERGAHPAFLETRAAQGDLQFDLWGVTPDDMERWDALREKIKQHGLRNCLMIAIAPTATIASIAGCYECIEPQVSNLFKRETLSGDFVQINKYLVRNLKQPGFGPTRSATRSSSAKARYRTSTNFRPS